MTEPSWTEAEIRAVTNDHYPIAAGDEDEGYSTYCRCEEWTSFDVEHIIDVLKASRPDEQTAVAALEAAPDRGSIFSAIRAFEGNPYGHPPTQNAPRQLES